MTFLNCYCGSLKDYNACCGLYIDKKQVALSPEALMRSRYSAYAQANIDYIMQTMCGPAAVGFDQEQARLWATRIKWLGLQVLKARYHRRDSNCAMVEFKAHYREDAVNHTIHEQSEFIRKNGRWFYCSGKHNED